MKRFAKNEERKVVLWLGFFSLFFLLLSKPVYAEAAGGIAEETPITEYATYDLDNGHHTMFYLPTAVGDHGAKLSVTAFLLEQDRRSKRLLVGGNLVKGDELAPGLVTFYVEFYRADASLIRKQAAFAKEPEEENGFLVMKWILPNDCAAIKLVSEK